MSFPKGITFAALQNFAGSTIVQNSQLYSHLQDNSTGNETSYFTPVEMIFRILISTGMVEGTITASGAAAPTGVGDGHIWLARAVSTAPPAISTVEELQQWDEDADAWVDIYDTPRPDLTAAMFQRLMDLPSGGLNCDASSLPALTTVAAANDTFASGSYYQDAGGVIHYAEDGHGTHNNNPTVSLPQYATYWSTIGDQAAFEALFTPNICAIAAAVADFTGQFPTASHQGILDALWEWIKGRLPDGTPEETSRTIGLSSLPAGFGEGVGAVVSATTCTPVLSGIYRIRNTHPLALGAGALAGGSSGLAGVHSVVIAGEPGCDTVQGVLSQYGHYTTDVRYDNALVGMLKVDDPNMEWVKVL